MAGAATGGCWAAETTPPANIPWPTLRIPKLSKPPVIDGVINADEWAGAAAITGFHPVYLDEIRCQWYVAYDDEWLYFAVHSPMFSGTWPVAWSKPDQDADATDMWRDSHLELELSSLPRNKAYQKGFYIIHANSRDAISDCHYNFNPGQEGKEWRGDYKVKSTAREGLWDIEMAIKRSSLTDKPFDNTEWVMHLVRADGQWGGYFFAWKYNWYVNCHEFPAVFFDPAIPVFRFLGLGEIRKGDMDVSLELVGRAKARTVEVSVTARDAEGKAILEKAEKITVAPGERKPIRFKDTLKYPEKGAVTLELRAYLDEGGKKVTLYEQKIPGLTSWTAEDERLRQDEITRRKNEVNGMKTSVAFLPTIGTVRCTVDNNVFGMPERITACRELRATVRAKTAPDKPLAQATIAIDPRTLSGETGIAATNLADGEYEVLMELINPAGKVADTKVVTFARRRYEWEGNTIGKDKVVIPPFPPLAVEGRTIRPWNRSYEIGQNGLVNRLVNGGDNILREPMRLEAEEGGKTVELTGRSVKVAAADAAGHTVLVESDGVLGSVPVTVHGNMEYDGFYLVTVDLKPTAPVTLGRLDLVLPMWSATDMAVVKRSDSIKGSYMGAFPAGDGVVWDSRQLGKLGSWGTFAPVVFAGTADKGLFWEAESMEGWNADPEQACVALERVAGDPQVRLRMFHSPTLLDKPRTIRFALRASPTKPMKANWRQIAWHYPESQVTWWGYTGYRCCGDGVNSFTLPSDEHFLKLREALLTPCAPEDKALPHRSWGGARQMREGKPLLMYGSNLGAGMAMKELETYCGEWLGGEWPEKPAPEAEQGRWNMGESLQWNDPRQLSAAWINVGESYMDCYLWYHQKYVRLTGVQGTWWDNSSMFTVWSPQPGTGKPVSKWNTFQRREFCKRLATMCWLEGKEPYWMEGMGTEISFNTITWMIENDFYVPSDTTLYEHLPMDQLKAELTLKRGLIPWLHTQGGEASTPEMKRLIGRSVDAIRLLHDIGQFPSHTSGPNTPRLLDNHFGFFDNAEDIEFIGYWRTGGLAQFRPSDPKADAKPVCISIYRHRRLGRCLIVIANTGAKPLEGSLWLNRLQLLPNPLASDTRRVTTLFDIEANQFMGGNYADRGDWSERFEWNTEKKAYETDPMRLPAHNHRLLVFE